MNILKRIIGAFFLVLPVLVVLVSLYLEKGIWAVVTLLGLVFIAMCSIFIGVKLLFD